MGDVVPTQSLPLYLDWQFWGAIVAAAALLLSQLPPIHLWFRPRRLEIEIHSQMVVTHKVGNPNLSVFLSLRNTGGRHVWIESIQVSVWRDNVKLFTLPAQNYYEEPSSQSAVLFVPFSLKAGESWSHSTVFLNFFDRQEQKNFRAAESALRADIQQKLRDRPETDKAMVVAAEDLVKPFQEMFAKKFSWLPGEYAMVVEVKHASSRAPIARKYRFTLFESDSAELQSHTDDYKYGGGLSYNVDRHVGIFVPIARHDG